ncbi:hypothetical protein VOLCADRAFT_105231 [Volvox carteri f. nagariensis]|uniref:PPIase cyclophilin-type domain-containing protein n=1 Tax=Volvox carteri f. nagariensis TaxID=3068 RepID=D8TZF2_VOLCA|nr:uncharacterized protein VOLCADRAFT_105231 [Volvox carteri f. nagariensis]EFJ47170.1 hypothetical protein VOLCADRAFT_105231 [Volvox carteri f. nagariensis]|eukprot:XP_002951719.1 hypothetical protein VOLCADRAFT_105231 [Volvox carteri f. nagariensis]
MGLKIGLLIVTFGSIALLCVAFVRFKSLCPPSVPAHLTDLDSLLDLLHEWETHGMSGLAAQSVSRVAAELATAMAAARSAQTTSPPTLASQATYSASNDLATEQAALRALSLAGTQCHVAWHTEYWGDTVVWGSAHHARSAAECCAACSSHQLAASRGGLDKGPNSTTCNVWVFCGDAARCGPHYQECWLKSLAKLPPPPQPGANSMWTSGVVYPGDEWLLPYQSMKTLTMHLPMGDVVVELLPDLAPRSVHEIRRLAAMLAGSACDGCKLYRVETNFLVQGVLFHPGGYVGTTRLPNPQQKKVMERGLACWAGCGGGPDFFVNLIDQSGFGDCHLCWGFIWDMSLMDAIVKLPTKPKASPNDMTFLAQELHFNITLS